MVLYNIQFARCALDREIFVKKQNGLRRFGCALYVLTMREQSSIRSLNCLTSRYLSVKTPKADESNQESEQDIEECLLVMGLIYSIPFFRLLYITIDPHLVIRCVIVHDKQPKKTLPTMTFDTLSMKEGHAHPRFTCLVLSITAGLNLRQRHP